MTAKTASQLPPDGGPAFPSTHATAHGGVSTTQHGNSGAATPLTYSVPGMSLRDYFAAHALAGLLARDPMGSPIEWHAIQAYDAADAMLKFRAPAYALDG